MKRELSLLIQVNIWAVLASKCFSLSDVKHHFENKGLVQIFGDCVANDSDE